MLESRSAYFPQNENPPTAKGWKVTAKVAFAPMEHPNGLDNPWNYRNAGCEGFSTKSDAEQWLDRSLKGGHILNTAVITIERIL